MAPEAIEDHGFLPDRQADIYALGVVFYELLTRRLPFTADNTAKLRRKILSDEPPRPTTFLYRLLTGKSPHEGGTVVEILLAHHSSLTFPQPARPVAMCRRSWTLFFRRWWQRSPKTGSSRWRKSLPTWKGLWGNGLVPPNLWPNDQAWTTKPGKRPFPS